MDYIMGRWRSVNDEDHMSLQHSEGRMDWMGASELWIKRFSSLPLQFCGRVIDGGLEQYYVFEPSQYRAGRFLSAAVPAGCWQRLARKAGFRGAAPEEFVVLPPMADDQIRETFRREIVAWQSYLVGQKDLWFHTARLHGDRYDVFSDQAQIEFDRLQQLLVALEGKNHE